MKDYFFIIILFSLSNFAIAQSGWTALESNTQSDLKDISAVSGLTAVAVGNNSTIIQTVNGGASWTAQNTNASADYNTVSFVNTNIGLAAGTSGTIIFTNNGGTNWETIETGWMHPYYAAHQKTPTVGAVAGVNSIFQPIVGLTSNGWQNYDFFVFYPQHDNSSQEGTIRDIYFFDSMNGIAVMEIWNGEGAFCATGNGGQSWSTVQWCDHALFGLDFWDANYGCAVGEGGTVLLTSNAGLTWEFSNPPTTQMLNDVSFGSANEVWIVGRVGSILYSDDAGITWDWQTSPSDANLNAVSMANADTGYIAGEDGTILLTISGGEIPNLPPGDFMRTYPADSGVLISQSVPFYWTPSVDPDGDEIQYLLRVWSVEPGEAWGDTSIVSTDTLVEIPLFADSIIYFHWTVDAIANGDTVEAANGQGNFEFWWETSAENPISYPSSFALSAFPNPFNPTTTIAFNLPKASKVKISVYDIRGRLAETLADEFFIAGEHQIDFNGSALPSGIYFAKLEFENLTQTQKMVLMK